jgi:hypothetical protein
MNKFLILIIFITVALHAKSQNLVVFKDDKTNKYGFKDANGKIKTYNSILTVQYM